MLLLNRVSFLSLLAASVDTLMCLHEFLSSRTTAAGAKRRVIVLCSTGEFFARQKDDLIFRCLELDSQRPGHTTTTTTEFKYICVGCASTKPASAAPDALGLYTLRKTLFRESAEQREQAYSFEAAEKNIRNLSLFSIVFDMLSCKMSNDITLKSRAAAATAEVSDAASFFKSSSFVLYNCSRIRALLDTIENKIQNGKFCLF